MGIPIQGNPRPGPATFGWGLFCACSWTWGIAMYLPVVLLGRFGWPGFLAFAIPNVLGCTAFGYVLRRRAPAAEHRVAMTSFSAVVIALHMFFVVFLLGVVSALGSAAWGAVAAVAVFAAGLALSRMPDRAWPLVAAVVYAGSVAAFFAVGVAPLAELGFCGDSSWGDLVWLTPTFIFGFLLCPYLDLTFYRALQRSPSRHAFGVFGLSFPVILLLTCAYSQSLSEGLTVAVIGHLIAQTVFTIAAHAREIRLSTWPVAANGRRLLLLAPLAVVPLGLMALATALVPANTGEGIYLRFLVPSALVFPAYVLLFMGPGRALPLSRRNLTAFAVVILAALPLYELAFIGDHAWLVVFPLGGLIGWKAVAQNMSGLAASGLRPAARTRQDH